MLESNFQLWIVSSFRKFCAFVWVQRGASEIFEKQKLQPPAESQLCCYRSFVISVIYIWSLASFRISADNTFFWRIFRLGAFVDLEVSATADNSPIQVSFLSGSLLFLEYWSRVVVFSSRPSWILKFQLQPTIVLFKFPFYRDRYFFWSIDLESSSLAAVLRGVFVQAASHQDIFLGSHFTCVLLLCITWIALL